MPDTKESPGATHVDIDEYERSNAAPAAPPKASEFKVDGDDIPEEFRGKTATEIARQAAAFQSALRISEDARGAMRASMESRQPTPAAAPVVEEEKIPTREEIKALYDEDPIAAIEKMQEIAVRATEKNLNVRLGAMSASTASLAENWAREEFADEFKLFGEEIKTFVSKIPDKTPLATKEGWENMISYIRGMRGNFEKLIDFRTKGPGRTSTEARIEQEAAAGFSGTNGSARTPVPAKGPSTITDEVEKDIVKEFIALGTFKDEAEYHKWKNLGAA